MSKAEEEAAFIEAAKREREQLVKPKREPEAVDQAKPKPRREHYCGHCNQRAVWMLMCVRCWKSVNKCICPGVARVADPS